jgi:hypothetical protein
MKGNYNDFLRALGYRESGGQYGIVNKYGYLGKYQMGEAALKDAGYYKGDYTRKNDWIGEWTGKDGVWSKEDFLRSPRAQERAIREFHRKMWKYIKALGLDRYIGRVVRGIYITESGLLGGAHLLGAGNLKKFLYSNGRIVPTDGHGTPITEYIHRFANYDISEITGSRPTYSTQPAGTNYNDSGFVWDTGSTEYDTNPSNSDFYDSYSDNYSSNDSSTSSSSNKKSIWDLFF